MTKFGEQMTTVAVVRLLTVTWNEPVEVFPDESNAEQLTVVVPIGMLEPEAGLHETGTAPLKMSYADAV